MALSAHAGGFGEYAGYLVFNTSVNSSQTEAWTLINQYNYSITFTVTAPNLTINASNVTPVLTFSALNGTIPAGSNYQINVTAFIPYGAPANTVWSGYATAYASGGGGNGSVKIQIGTSKFIKVISRPYVPPKVKPKPKSQSTNSITNNTSNTLGASSEPANNNSNYLIYVVIILAMALIGAIAYILGMKSGKSEKTANNTSARTRKNK